jgi:type II secretion system protein N
MQRIFRVVAIVIGSLVALCALAVIGLNLYVQSVGAQARIQQELSHRLGVPVKIRSISITPWGGLTVGGISVTDPARKTDFLTAKAFEMHAAISSILSGDLVIKKVSLVRPNVLWAQDQDGRWRLPGEQGAPALPGTQETGVAPAAPPPAPEDSMESSPSPPAVVPLAPVIEEPAPRVAHPKAVRQIVPDIRRAAIRDGNFRFLDKRDDLVAAFEGVELQTTIEHSDLLQGVVHIERLSAHDRFFLQKIRSPFKYSPDGVELSRISARAAGGEIDGQFSVRPAEENSPFHLNVRFKNLKADDVVTDAGGNRGTITGELDGTLDASGKAGDENGMTGSGEIILRNGKLQQYSLLVALGQILQIEELTQLQLDQAEAKYHLENGQVKVDDLVLRSPNLRLSATGIIALNGKLHLDAQLAINEKVRSQLFKPIRQNFQPTSDPQYSAVDFQVTGTLERPRTNLVDRIVGRDLKDLVSGFLGGKKSGKNKKAPRPDASPEESASPTASATPSPPT